MSTTSLSFDDPERLMSRKTKRIAVKFSGVNDERSAAIPTKKMELSFRLSERNISNKKLLYFDYFILQPRHAFVKPKIPLVP